eukprot:TRINITY_DN836_c1_g1_i2.p2 TRINITY_DN836_c1_g1~~TRINITY_DN836_c1_g1_i2.p2  ORF type:complete len:417 (+),score=61.79 TRINITY_DN836_c1_g1_i2:111-1361(+)
MTTSQIQTETGLDLLGAFETHTTTSYFASDCHYNSANDSCGSPSTSTTAITPPEPITRDERAKSFNRLRGNAENPIPTELFFENKTLQDFANDILPEDNYQSENATNQPSTAPVIVVYDIDPFESSPPKSINIEHIATLPQHEDVHHLGLVGSLSVLHPTGANNVSTTSIYTNLVPTQPKEFSLKINGTYQNRKLPIWFDKIHDVIAIEEIEVSLGLRNEIEFLLFQENAQVRLLPNRCDREHITPARERKERTRLAPNAFVERIGNLKLQKKNCKIDVWLHNWACLKKIRGNDELVIQFTIVNQKSKWTPIILYERPVPTQEQLDTLTNASVNGVITHRDVANLLKELSSAYSKPIKQDRTVIINIVDEERHGADIVSILKAIISQARLEIRIKLFTIPDVSFLFITISSTLLIS